MTNVQFIIQYLSEYPDSRYTDITKALCAWKGKAWTRGHYCRYFVTNPGGGSYNWITGRRSFPVIYPNHLWRKGTSGRWSLTHEGFNRAESGGLQNIW